MTTKNTIASLETMKSLMKQSEELVLQQKKDLEVEREELLKKAVNKVNDYLEGVLESMPFHSITIRLDKEFDLLLRKNDPHSTLSVYGERLERFYIFSRGRYQYITANKNYVGAKFQGSTPVFGISVDDLLFLVDNFDRYKEHIESTILRKAHNYLDDQMKKMQAEQDTLDSLKAFVG